MRQLLNGVFTLAEAPEKTFPTLFVALDKSRKVSVQLTLCDGKKIVNNLTFHFYLDSMG